jgi:hypothetical protein
MEIARLQENLNNSYYIYRAGHTVLSSSIYNVTAYTPGLHEFIPTYSGVRVVRSLIFSVLFCRSIFFFWPLLCVHLRFTASVYLFGIFKLIFYVILVHVYTYFELLKIRIDDAQWLNRSKITDKTYKHKHSLTLLLYCPCLCYHSFLQNTMSSCSLEANLSIFLKIVCLYVLRWRFNYLQGRVWVLFTGLNPPQLCAYPKPVPGFPTSYVVVVLEFNYLRCEVICRFVDIAGHHCLIFLFVMPLIHNCPSTNGTSLVLLL